MKIEDGKVKWKNCNKLILTENCLELMENRLSSSGIFSQDVRHWKSSEKSRKTCKTRQEPREEIHAGALDIPWTWKRKHGKSNYFREGKWQDTANMMVEQFEESGHPVFRGVSPMVRGNLRKNNNKKTIHFNADASSAEFFNRAIHSANQL